MDTVASGFDGTLRRIERGYDSRGMAASVTQYDADGDVDTSDVWHVSVSNEPWQEVAVYRATASSGEIAQADALDSDHYILQNWRRDVVLVLGSAGERVHSNSSYV